MKPTLSAILLLLSLWACVPSPSVVNPPQTITWRTLAQARAEALATNRPILIDFFTFQECPRCQDLVRFVYSDPTIIERINREFVPVRVNLDQPLSPDEKALATRLESGEECVLAFLSAKGSIVTHPNGKPICSLAMLTPEAFTDYLDEALKHVGQQ